MRRRYKSIDDALIMPMCGDSRNMLYSSTYYIYVGMHLTLVCARGRITVRVHHV